MTPDRPLFLALGTGAAQGERRVAALNWPTEGAASAGDEQKGCPAALVHATPAGPYLEVDTKGCEFTGPCDTTQPSLHVSPLALHSCQLRFAPPPAAIISP